MNEPNAYLTILRMLTPGYQFRAHRRQQTRRSSNVGISQHPPRQRRRTVCRLAQDWQMPSRNRLGRKAECKVYNAVSHIQASGTNPTIPMISRLIRKDSRQVRRIIKRLELAGPLSWLHHAAKYRNNRRQYVPILLRWERLRQVEDVTPISAAIEPEVILHSSNEPTLSSTLEPTLTKSLSIKSFGKEEQIQTECARARSNERASVQLPDNSKTNSGETQPPPHDDTVAQWETEAGLRIPEKDVLSVARLILVRCGLFAARSVLEASPESIYDALGEVCAFWGSNQNRDDVLGWEPAENLDRWFLAFLIETVWKRATKPERHWRAFYAAAILKMFRSQKSMFGALARYQKRDELYRKWYREPDVAAWTPERIREYREKAGRA
jgi:hypothetical protein